jgi:hypothetical protein
MLEAVQKAHKCHPDVAVVELSDAGDEWIGSDAEYESSPTLSVCIDIRS